MGVALCGVGWIRGGNTSCLVRPVNRLAAHAALPRAFVLGHVAIETG
jgi:hypothetical protein